MYLCDGYRFVQGPRIKLDPNLKMDLESIKFSLQTIFALIFHNLLTIFKTKGNGNYRIRYVTLLTVVQHKGYKCHLSCLDVFGVLRYGLAIKLGFEGKYGILKQN